MSRFVLLLHECPSGVPRDTHWDLMLEDGNVLRTWVLAALPEAWRAATRDSHAAGAARSETETAMLQAEEIQPHRLDYLWREGALSGDRGSVRQLDAGTYTVLEMDTCRIRARLAGRRLCGTLALWRPHGSTPHWQLSFSARPTSE